MNLAYKYPKILWDCACLITDAGGTEKTEEEIENEEVVVEEYAPLIEEFVENEEEDEEEEEETTTTKKPKKKTATTNYGKISAAIGKMKANGILVSAPDINKSTYTFSPDVDNEIIRYGMSGIVKVGEDVVKQILENRPYENIEDFLSKVKVNKSQMVNLIKAGAFDDLYSESREDIMKHYIELISEPKKTLNLRNMQKLIEFDLLPSELDFSKRVFNYNKYLKKLKIGEEFMLDEIAFEFYEKYFDLDLLAAADTESGFKISCSRWKKVYDSYMLKPKEYIKKNLDDLLKRFNQILFDDLWNKYCVGSISKWEMDSVSYYSHEHELANTKQQVYDCVDFFKLDEEPEIDRIISIKGKQVPLFKIVRIMGTVLDRDKAKKSVTILTTSGVVTVKIYGEVFAHYDKQISELGADGKKHVKEHSFFKRGQKIIVTGIRRGDQFFGKKYSKTPWHLVELITDIDNEGWLTTKGTRYGAEE
jgi:DNA polymerase-3 subunit alpha